MNVSKIKTMIVFRLCTMHPQSPPLTIGGTVLKEFNDLVILGVTIDSKMTLISMFGGFPGAGCWKLSAITYVAADGVRHLESPPRDIYIYNRSSFRFTCYPWRNLRQVRRCLRICYAIAGGSANSMSTL